ncbi:MAG TPA: GAF domain-containing protein, partial [Vicinamibacteria bacterium]|nr:GAF domain-containing protein [Vicinamibacteria bacterium]
GGGGGGADYSGLKASLHAIEKGTNLSEILTHLVNEVAQYVDRAAMFIVKGPNAIGWYARGVQPPDAVKSVTIPLSGETVFRIVYNSRHAERGHISQAASTAQALVRLGGDPQGILAVPLILRDKLAAILYCDSTQEEIPGSVADAVEILVSFAAKTIDLISASPRPAGPISTGGTSGDRAAAIRAGAEAAHARPAVSRPPSAPPAGDGEGGSTVVFSPSAVAGVRQAAGRAPAPPPPPRPTPSAPPAGRGHSPEDQKAHEDAKRFARLVVSEIKLYNESKVNEGRRNKDIYERLKEDIERGRQMYTDRVPGNIRDSTNYFYDELVRILAGGDAAALGSM